MLWEAMPCICVGCDVGGRVEGGSNDLVTHLISPKCLEVIQDLSNEGLTQLVDL